MIVMTRIESILARYPDLKLLSRDPGRKYTLSDLRASFQVARSVEKGLIMPDEHLLPTTAREIFRDLVTGNALIVYGDDSKAVGYTAYTHRLTREFKISHGMQEKTYGMCELYCIVIGEEYRNGRMGTTLAYELAAQALKKGKNDTMSFITFQVPVVKLARGALGLLKQDGIEVEIKAFSCEQLPFLSLFLTFANPNKYTPEDLQRIEETNPRWKADSEVLAGVNDYLSNRGNPSFSLDGNMIYISSPEEAEKTDAALKKTFGNRDSLKEALVEIDYSI